VKLVVPLTGGAPVGRNRTASAKLPEGWLVVVDEPWFEHGGLGEGLAVQILKTASGQNEEFGMDPIVSLTPTKAELALTVKGPIGYTFDDTAVAAPVFLHTSFVLTPGPKAEPWLMARVAFVRTLEGSGVKLESKPSAPFWIQALPNASSHTSVDGKLRVTGGKTEATFPEDKGMENRFSSWVLVTKRVYDARGEETEAYVGIGAALSGDNDGRLTLPEAGVGDTLYARILTVQSRARDDIAPKSIAKFEPLKLLFPDEAKSPEPSARIVAIGDRLDVI
jgi:hypothetical protein